MSEMTAAAHVPQWDVADRMRKALRESEVGVQDMADYLGVGRGTVSTWINGRIEPSRQTLRLWALRCGVSYEWLTNDERPQPVRAEASSLPRLDSNQQPADYATSLASAALHFDELAAWRARNGRPARDRRRLTRRLTPRPFVPFVALPATAAR